jgi:hypothetical protein
MKYFHSSSLSGPDANRQLHSVYSLLCRNTACGPNAPSFAIVAYGNKIYALDELAMRPCPRFSGCAALFTIIEIGSIMKKLFSVAALLLLISPLSQAQVHSDSGSAKPKNLRDMRYNERQLHEAEQARKRRVLVRCRDGSKHIVRVCRRHGGVA